MNSIFVMTHAKIKQVYTDKTTFTWAKIVVNFCPPKEDPYQIRIMAGSNLIKYKGDMLTRTVDLPTSKLLRNSVLSTNSTRNMCLHIKNFYLTALSTTLSTCKCPWGSSQNWFENNTNLTSMHIKVLCTYKWNAPFGAYHRLGYLPTNFSKNGLHHMDIMSASILPACGNTSGNPSHSPLL